MIKCIPSTYGVQRESLVDVDKLLSDKDRTKKKGTGLGRVYKKDVQMWQPAGLMMWIWKYPVRNYNKSHKNEISPFT